MANKTLVRAKKSFFASTTRRVRRGETFLSTDPMVKGREHLFEDAVPEGHEVVERATAAPGEKRNVVRKREKAKPDAAE